MTTPIVSLPSLRAFLGAIALNKSQAANALGLFSLQGGLTQNDLDVASVVNALVAFVTGGTSGYLSSTAAIPAQGSTVTLALTSNAGLVVNKVYRAVGGGQTMTFTCTAISGSTGVTATAWAASGDTTGTLPASAFIYPVTSAVVLRPSGSITIPDGEVNVHVRPLAGAASTVSLPAHPSIGQTVTVLPSTDAATNNVSISRNGSNINEVAYNPLPLSTSAIGGTQPGTSTAYVFTAESATNWEM